MRNTRIEYFISDVSSITDIARTSRDVRVVPKADLERGAAHRYQRPAHWGEGSVPATLGRRGLACCVHLLLLRRDARGLPRYELHALAALGPHAVKPGLF